MQISLLLDLAADSFPERIAIDGPAGQVSYEGLRARARVLAHYLQSAEVAACGYLGVNSPDVAAGLFGAALAGVPFAPLNYRLPDADLRRLALRLAPAVILADDDMALRLAGLDGVKVLSRHDFAALPDGAEPDWAEGDTAVQLFTSGTSGEPKAALLSHDNLTSYIMQTVEFASAGEDEAGLVSVPPYHIAGISALLSSVCATRRIVQLPAFDPTLWVAAVARYRVTSAMLVPTMLSRILDVLPEGETLPSLRALACGGGRMPRPVILAALARLPHVGFTNAYGLTETSSTISLLGPEDHDLCRSGDALALQRLDSVGRPVPGIEVEIRDPEGRLCGPMEPGEVMVRGEQVSGRYAGRSAVDAGGWFATRDRGWMDAEGYLFLDGRLDDVIVRGGENISPGEIEDVLRADPRVADVAVIGAPDVEWGEKIVAFVVAREEISPPELQDLVKDRLRSTRVPGEIRFCAELPYNDTGKLLRRVLRDRLTAA